MKFKHMAINELAATLADDSDMLLLDYRDPQSFQRGCVPGAQFASDELITRLIARKHKQGARKIVVYCYRGHRSRDLAGLFGQLGFTNVFSLDGGWQAWSDHTRAAIPVSTPELVSWMSEHGFDHTDINKRIDNGMSALMVAALKNEKEIVQHLIESGIEVNLINDDGNNALWFACVGGDIDIINTLVTNHVDINRQNVNGATCLIYAASAGKIDVVKALVKAGADLTISTHDDFNALDSAATLPVLRYLKPRYEAIQPL